MGETITYSIDDIREVIGIIWNGDDKPLLFSVFIKGVVDIVYAESALANRRIRERALAEGISLGDMVDKLNAELNERDKRRGLPTVTWQIRGEEAKKLIDLFRGKFDESAPPAARTPTKA